jgi:hypothetical protein
MALPAAFASTRHTEPAGPAGQPGRRLRVAGLAAALVIGLGGGRTGVASPADRGVMIAAAAPGAVVVGPRTRLIVVAGAG